MEESYEIRENRIIAWLGGLIISLGVLMALIFIAGGITDGVGAAVVFVAILVGAGALILIDGVRRKLEVRTDGSFKYTPFIGPSREFGYTDIDHAECRFGTGNPCIILRSHDGKKLCKLESNMVNSGKLAGTLTVHGICVRNGMQGAPQPLLVQEPIPEGEKARRIILYCVRALSAAMLIGGMIYAAGSGDAAVGLIIYFGSVIPISIYTAVTTITSEKGVYKNGVIYGATLNGFESRNDSRIAPTFIFTDPFGSTHMVSGLTKMKIKKRDRQGYIGRNYKIWYAPQTARGVLYGGLNSDRPDTDSVPKVIIQQVIFFIIYALIAIPVIGDSRGADSVGKSMEIEWSDTMGESTLTHTEAEKSSTVQWFTDTYSLYTVFNGMQLGEIGGVDPEDPNQTDGIKTMLKDGWSITDRDSAISGSNRLLEQGHRMKYRKMAKQLKKEGLLDLSEDAYMEKIPDKDNAIRYRAIYEAYHRFGDKGIDAWDYAREIKLLAHCYAAGYITLDECLDQSLPAAEQIQSEYGSWNEMFESYMYGYEFWCGKDNTQNQKDIEDYQHDFSIVTRKGMLALMPDYKMTLKKDW